MLRVIREWRLLSEMLVECEQSRFVGGRVQSPEQRVDERLAPIQIRSTHTAARVKQHGDAQPRVVSRSEVDNRSGLAILEDVEVIPSEVSHQSIPRITDDSRDRDDRTPVLKVGRKSCA
jgi:hypothetical protein